MAKFSSVYGKPACLPAILKVKDSYGDHEDFGFPFKILISWGFYRGHYMTPTQTMHYYVANHSKKKHRFVFLIPPCFMVRIRLHPENVLTNFTKNGPKWSIFDYEETPLATRGQVSERYFSLTCNFSRPNFFGSESFLTSQGWTMFGSVGCCDVHVLSRLQEVGCYYATLGRGLMIDMYPNEIPANRESSQYNSPAHHEIIYI